MSMNIVRRVSTDSYNKFRFLTARGRFPRAAVINDKATFAGLVTKRMHVPLRLSAARTQESFAPGAGLPKWNVTSCKCLQPRVNRDASVLIIISINYANYMNSVHHRNFINGDLADSTSRKLRELGELQKSQEHYGF